MTQKSNPEPITRPSDEIRIAGDALAASIQHEARGHGDATMALVDKYAEKISPGSPSARSYLVVFAAEVFGLYCDRLARGFSAWARGFDGDVGAPPVEIDAENSAIQCPGCGVDMNVDVLAAPADDDLEHVCPACGWRERRG